MKQKEQMAEQTKNIHEQDAAISERSEQLTELTMKISDAEKLVDDVADAAYNKAIEAVADTVQVETHSQDLEVLADYQKWLLDPARKAPIKQREFAAGHLGKVAVKIRDSVKKVRDAIRSLLRDPKKKKEILVPIKENAKKSLLARLKAAKAETADDNGMNRREESRIKEKENRIRNVDERLF